MIFAFTEDGVLEILESAAQACTRYEGVDVDAGAVQFYDADGRPLVARFSAPNRSDRLLGLLPWVESGVYELVEGAENSNDAFALALYETTALTSNRWFDSLEHLKGALRTRGVAVDFE